MAPAAGNHDVSMSDGATITAQAQTWKGTPYQLVGPGSIVGIGGDCSGSTWRILGAAGFDYDYQATATFL
jgi:cell wall-associated NlpC family hydrolase